MYSREDKQNAVDLLIKYNFAYSTVIREIGYPKSRTTLRKWYYEFRAKGCLTESNNRKPKYSIDDKNKAINHYLEYGKNISNTVRVLGYPSRVILSNWIQEAGVEKKINNAGGLMVKYSKDKKKEAAIDLLTRDSTANRVAKAHDVSRTSLYKWSESLLSNEVYQMYTNDRKSPNIIESDNEKTKLIDENEKLKKENERLRFENDILEKAAELLKKEVGINLVDLSNLNKAVLIDALRDKYPLKQLLIRLKIAKSSYFYQVHSMDKVDKYKNLRIRIKEIFESAYNAYGYRRIYIQLKNESITISEKVIRRLMKEEGLIVKTSIKKKYNSYLGEISPAVENIINRNFKADNPNEKWVTDITEFALSTGKVYLSPIIDCFDGLPICWSISTSPNAELVNTMLDNAINTLSSGEHPIVHSDRGAHYRWPGWIERMEKSKLIRSMSKKGCSPDNSACEGFFGTIKQEMFYSRTWANISVGQFINYLNNYLEWYSNERIKCSLNGMSPINYRKSLGLI